MRFGAWLRGSRQVLKFKTGLAEGEEILVLVRLAGTHWASKGEVVVNLRGGDPRGGKTGEVRRPVWTLAMDSIVRLMGRVQHDGVCAIEFRIGEVDFETADKGDEERNIGVGLLAVGYARKASLAERVELLESI